MSFLLFIAALLAIVVFAVVVNRVTGTKARYIEQLQLDAAERELWRDTEADFALVPRTGRALVMSFVRLRRHTVVWTDLRTIVAQKALFSARRMITHQIISASASDSRSVEARDASREFFGGFYGRGFTTLIALHTNFDQVGGKDCVRIQPTEACGVALNVDEILIFTDRIAELRNVT
ncbi:MAG TPA: hypothetical protein VK524_06405 [Polyangiaceae bacterium]|nr:hypothetical protein [Polyangiaceae bacterium]